MVTDGGSEVGFHGEYREIVPNERIVSTETYEGLPEGVSDEEGHAEHRDVHRGERPHHAHPPRGGPEQGLP